MTSSTQQLQNMQGLHLIVRMTGGDPKICIRQATYLRALTHEMYRGEATSYRTLRRILKSGLIEQEPIPSMKKGFYLRINGATKPHLRNLTELIEQEKKRERRRMKR